MKLTNKLKLLYSDKLAAGLANLSILFIVATWVLFLFRRVKHSPLTTLHYNIYSGIDIIGSWQWLYFIPATVLLISLLDFVLAVLLWIRNRNLSYFLLATILLMNFIIFFYIYNIFNYN
jgi:hypothetical protein